jgi:hypothetical protein
MIIGGLSLQAHNYTRQTIDCDCMIRLCDLEAFRAGVAPAGYTEAGRTQAFARFSHRDRSSPPMDVMLVDDATFEKVWAASFEYDWSSARLRVPALLHLVALKLHAVKNNPERLLKDFADIQELFAANTSVITEADLLSICQRYGPPESFRILRPHLR